MKMNGEQKEKQGLKQNPCRYCSSSIEYKGRHTGSSFNNECIKCEYSKSHKKYLESQRKFTEGETITSIEELITQEWVMWNHSIKHIEIFKHMHLGIVLRYIENGAFKKAVVKQPE
jgi:DNA-directed RNA polymerase subunit RPC12/RpoP